MDAKFHPAMGAIKSGDLDDLKLPKPVKELLQATIDRWSHESQNIIDNAFVYACMHNHIDAARLLLPKGAQINSTPPGFHYPGTALHNAAVNGHRAMVEFLIERRCKCDGQGAWRRTRWLGSLWWSRGVEGLSRADREIIEGMNRSAPPKTNWM